MSSLIRRFLKSISKNGSTPLQGDVTLSEGTGVSITQTGQDIEIAATGGGGGTVDTVVAGTNIDVDATDPANPIVSVETLTLADISDVTASATELNYVDGVTSAIQTQLNAKGDVTGPASSTDNEIPMFDGTTGKAIGISGVIIGAAGLTRTLLVTGDGTLAVSQGGVDMGAVVGISGSQTLTNKTIDAANNTISNINNGNWSGTDLSVANGGTGRSTNVTAYSLLASGTTATGALQTLPAGGTTEMLVGGGPTALPTWETATGSGAPVRATSPTLTTPNLGTPSALTLTNATGLPTAGLVNAAVTPSKLGTGAAAAYVATSQTTTSTTYTDLATTGPAVTVTIGANGLALVSLFMGSSSNTATANQHMGFAISGASTQAAADEWSCQVRQVDANALGFERQSAVFLVTGLSAGSTTFTAKYRVNAGTGTFIERRIAVVPL